MNNYKQPGEIIDWVNGTGAAVASGALVKIGTKVGVAVGDIAIGATGSVRVWGVAEVPRLTTDATTQGEALYLDNTNHRVTEDAASGANIYAGYAFTAAAATVPTVLLKLNG